jgi:hypothetical protein
MADFMQALAGATQVKGGFYEPQAQAHAIEAMVARLEQGLYPLPELGPAELAARPVREKHSQRGRDRRHGRDRTRRCAAICRPGRAVVPSRAARPRIWRQPRSTASAAAPRFTPFPADPRDSDAIAAAILRRSTASSRSTSSWSAPQLPESRGPRRGGRPADQRSRCCAPI